MTKTYFIFILIIILAFIIYNTRYEKLHQNKSILQETKVKETIEKARLIDEIIRFLGDLSYVSA